MRYHIARIPLANILSSSVPAMFPVEHFVLPLAQQHVTQKVITC